MSASNPLTAVYNALWTLLEQHRGFTALVRPGNRIKFAGARRDPMKAEICEGDLPEVRLTCTGGSAQIQRTSSSGSITKRFEVQIATGDQRLEYDAGVLAVEWEVLKAMHGWRAVLGALIWEDKAFVKTCKLLDVRVGVTDTDLNRGIKGWSAVWACEVEMWFATADLQPTT
jgi:hypothetical protein